MDADAANFDLLAIGTYLGIASKLFRTQIGNQPWNDEISFLLVEMHQLVLNKPDLVLKAPRSVSHRRRLKLESEGEVAQGRDLLHYFMMGCLMIPADRRGPVLLQLPESMRINLERLDQVLALFDQHGLRVAVEVRHESWLVDETFLLLSRYKCALVATQWKVLNVPLTVTSDFVYLRCHGPDPLNPYRGGYSKERLKMDF